MSCYNCIWNNRCGGIKINNNSCKNFITKKVGKVTCEYCHYFLTCNMKKQEICDGFKKFVNGIFFLYQREGSSEKKLAYSYSEISRDLEIKETVIVEIVSVFHGARAIIGYAKIEKVKPYFFKFPIKPAKTINEALQM